MVDVASFDPVKAEEILREVVTPETWRDISRKVAREKLEEKLGVAPESFKAVKNEINEIIDKIVEELADEDASGSEAGGSDSDDEAEPTPKKQKTGAGPPKNLKKLQSTIMSRQSFLEQAPVMASKIGEMVFDMKPRTFSSGSCGWFHGGKVAIKFLGARNGRTAARRQRSESIQAKVLLIALRLSGV
ncbi:hypothetical protein Esti_004773 [Eimeria stiedai]